MASDRGVDLRVRVSADLADIKQGLGLLRGELAKVKADAARAAPDAASWSNGIGAARAELGNLAGAYVGVQSVASVVSSLFDALDRADRFDEMAQSAGVSTEALSRLSYAAKFSSVDVDALGKGLRKLADEAASNKGFLGQLGIDIADAAGNARSADAIFADLADVFAAMPDGPEKAALAMKLFGERVGPGLVPLLNAGKQGLQDLGVEAERAGNVLDSATSKAAAELADNLDRLKLQMQGVANEAVKQLIPAVSGYAEAAFAASDGSRVAAEGGEILADSIKVGTAVFVVAKNVVEGLVNFLAMLGTVAVETAGFIGGSLTRSLGGFAGLAADLVSGKNPIDAYNDRIKGMLSDIADNAKAAGSGIAAGASAMRDGIAESAADIGRISELFSGAQQEVKAVNAEAGPAAAKSSELLAKVRGLLADDGADKKPEKTKEKIERLAASMVLLEDTVNRAKVALDRQFDDKQISIADYYARRVELQRQSIDLQIAQLHGELEIAEGLEKRRQIEEKIIILQRDRQQVGVDAAREQAKAEQDLSQAQQKALNDRLSGLSGGLSAREGSLSAQIEAGTIGYVEGERQLQQVRASTLEQLRALRAEQAAYLAGLSTSSPQYAEAQQTLLGIDAQIANIGASMNQLRSDTMDVGVSSLTSFFTNLRDGATSAGDAFRSLVADFADGIYQMLAEATAKQLVSAVAGLFGGGAGGEAGGVMPGAVALSGAATATSAAGGAIAVGATQLSISAGQLMASASALAAANAVGGGSMFGVAHGGGTAGALRVFRGGIDPMVFGAAPRYHGGGVAGLQGNEIPAILQRGEIIRTRQQEAALQARMGGGQSAAAPIRNIIVFGEDELASALSGAAGERVIVNHVRRNQGSVSA